jgi:hypothetical protein
MLIYKSFGFLLFGFGVFVIISCKFRQQNLTSLSASDMSSFNVSNINESKKGNIVIVEESIMNNGVIVSPIGEKRPSDSLAKPLEIKGVSDTLHNKF